MKTVGVSLLALAAGGLSACGGASDAPLRPAVNLAPDAQLSAATNNPKIGRVVVLDASGSTDPNDDTLSFRFTQLSGPPTNLVQDGSAQATVFVPEIRTQEQAVFEVRVSDGFAADTATTTLTIDPLRAPGPLADLAVAEVVTTVFDGAPVSASYGRIRDADGDGIEDFPVQIMSRVDGGTSTLSEVQLFDIRPTPLATGLGPEAVTDRDVTDLLAIVEPTLGRVRYAADAQSLDAGDTVQRDRPCASRVDLEFESGGFTPRESVRYKVILGTDSGIFTVDVDRPDLGFDPTRVDASDPERLSDSGACVLPFRPVAVVQPDATRFVRLFVDLDGQRILSASERRPRLLDVRALTTPSEALSWAQGGASELAGLQFRDVSLDPSEFVPRGGVFFALFGDDEVDGRNVVARLRVVAGEPDADGQLTFPIEVLDTREWEDGRATALLHTDTLASNASSGTAGNIIVVDPTLPYLRLLPVDTAGDELPFAFADTAATFVDTELGATEGVVQLLADSPVTGRQSTLNLRLLYPSKSKTQTFVARQPQSATPAPAPTD